MPEKEARKAFVEAALPAGDLALINARYALAPLSAEELYVRRMVLANDALNRTYERFPAAVLERFGSRRMRPTRAGSQPRSRRARCSR
jgi:hypothetical protein